LVNVDAIDTTVDSGRQVSPEPIAKLGWRDELLGFEG
jgi:hypothetical protein